MPPERVDADGEVLRLLGEKIAGLVVDPGNVALRWIKSSARCFCLVRAKGNLRPDDAPRLLDWFRAKLRRLDSAFESDINRLPRRLRPVRPRGARVLSWPSP
jgi:hypothetical protein